MVSYSHYTVKLTKRADYLVKRTLHWHTVLVHAYLVTLCLGLWQFLFCWQPVMSIGHKFPTTNKNLVQALLQTCSVLKRRHSQETTRWRHCVGRQCWPKCQECDCPFLLLIHSAMLHGRQWRSWMPGWQCNCLDWRSRGRSLWLSHGITWLAVAECG